MAAALGEKFNPKMIVMMHFVDAVPIGYKFGKWVKTPEVFSHAQGY